jgi:hypothetical protein
MTPSFPKNEASEKLSAVHIAAHHGDSTGARKVARVAVARKIVTLV